MAPVLRLTEDILANGAEVGWPPCSRMIFVVHGTVTVAGHTRGDGEAWHSESGVSVRAGNAGATLWRWELSADAQGLSVPAAGAASREKLAARLETLPAGELLWRGDSVAFPPGGCAYRHRHQGPGIRCLIEGGIRIDTHGLSTSYGPGGAWFENGPDPVFAQAAADRPSRFIRVMVLPRTLLGKSSIEYLNEEDKADRKSTRLNSSHRSLSRMPSSA